MKKYTAYLLISIASLGTGCKKYLEQAPDQRTKLNTPEKVSELLVTAYPSGSYIMLAEAMSDNLSFNSTTGYDKPENRDAYFWKDVEGTGQDTPNNYWNDCYAAIAAANQALDAIDKISDPQNYSAQKGEALVARAYAHFMLVTFFSKCYDPATAATDPGIPYVTTPESVVLKNYERKTVTYVYEQIEKDLLAGIPLLKDEQYRVPAYHFTHKAAYAFATRFYLFKKDMAKVVQYAGLAFPANNFAANVRPWLAFGSPTGGSTEIAQNMSSAANPGNLLLCETSSWAARNYARTIYSLSQNRLNSILAPVGLSLNAYKTYSYSSTFYFVPKLYEHFVRTSINASTGVGYLMQSLLTTEEVLLNRAEAYIMQGKYAEALTDMNTLISTRMTNYVAASSNLTETKITTYYAAKTEDVKQAYLYALLDLKRAEFVEEGMRWMDILRLKMTVTHLDANGNTMELAADDKRKLWQLPSEVTLAGLAQNPR
ncbi:RagB/SusD family nutrient uptake outer membrane protein [Pedobacter sp. HMWF019]|uniref:RagB/SusD family nutrient uptake outer membrane protein n=1 Tax=Pedobacter sp. HMWF019 TaxID=2056856 RepID=UPI000D396507|nr:RagB/SusD family nutrient uptake outer membrane protein [Pedobacter sp. HMWF019]PTS95007.1 RagB/SusD family nutrient uptake outer membrane protein [Pedobacter sp. HMWF019]